MHNTYQYLGIVLSAGRPPLKCLFPLFCVPFFFLEFDEKISENIEKVLTNKQHAKHPFAGQNTQQL